jgi:hypothetical protein
MKQVSCKSSGGSASNLSAVPSYTCVTACKVCNLSRISKIVFAESLIFHVIRGRCHCDKLNGHPATKEVKLPVTNHKKGGGGVFNTVNRVSGPTTDHDCKPGPFNIHCYKLFFFCYLLYGVPSIDFPVVSLQNFSMYFF